LEAMVVSASRALRTPAPGIEAWSRHVERLARDRDRTARLLRLDERELHALSFAKKAAAFFRMSRSNRSVRFSRRSCASSARSSVVRPVLPLLRSARACFTQLARDDAVRSRSCATRETVLPSSKISRTAPAL